MDGDGAIVEDVVGEDKITVDDVANINVVEEEVVESEDKSVVEEGDTDIDMGVEDILVDEEVMLFTPAPPLRLAHVVPKSAVFLKPSTNWAIPLPVETSNLVFWL